MCGIVGFVAARDAQPPDPSGLHDAVLALRHRGPNESGTYVAGPVLLGNTRLSIIDLTGGSQPMSNEDGSIVVVYNGEIWNYRPLRDELASLGHVFATESDTEVLVHGFEEWGEELVEHLDGMFAFAAWDARRESLFLARDRFGKKPLYVQTSKRGVAFGSDARSVFLVSGTRPEIAREHVGEYLFQRYVVSPRTLFAGVDRLAPAHAGTYDRSTLRTRKYWTIDAPVPARALGTEELRTLLEAATVRRLMSDVPVGVLLSGGVDSTTILALASLHADGLATFTVGFDDPIYDERAKARQAARHYGTEHHELLVGKDDFLAAWPRLAWFRDEPVAEASEIPLLLLSEFAGRHVRVALSGDGGDEVFGGYPKYRADAIIRMGGRPAVTALKLAIGALSRRRTHRLMSRASDTLPIRDPLLRWVSWFRTMDHDAVNSLLHPELRTAPVSELLAQRLGAQLEPYAQVDAGRRMLLGDLFTYLPDNMLLRSDKVLMGGSLEGRMPLLDLALVERATAAPAAQRSAVLRPKRVLREAAKRIVPRELGAGPKRGFPVPVERFLVEDGRRLVEALLLSDRCLSRGVFAPDALRGVVTGTSGALPASGLFALASFELWARMNVDDVSTSPSDSDVAFGRSTSRALTGASAAAR
jgi:asparagine synthase (glutamine-hydrolysing)